MDEFKSKAMSMSVEELEKHAEDFRRRWLSGNNGLMANQCLLYAEGLIITARKYRRLKEQFDLMNQLNKGGKT